MNADKAALLMPRSPLIPAIQLRQMDEEFFLQMSKLMRAGLDISHYPGVKIKDPALPFVGLLS